MANQITYGDASRTAILHGINSLTDAVKVTLGPKGRNVILERKFGAPTITKDGVTVAKEIDLKNALVSLGAQMVKEAASQTSDVAGDGTTTATVLTQATRRREERDRGREPDGEPSWYRASRGGDCFRADKGVEAGERIDGGASRNNLRQP